MPQPRKSAEVHRLTGTYRRDRHGAIPVPEGKPLGKPPRDWPADLQLAWKDITTAGAGRLVEADRVHAELAARCLARVRSPDGKAADGANLLRALACMGVDAVHRRALAKPAEPNEFDEF